MPVAKRSSAPKVLGILNLIGGILGLLGSLFTLLMLVIGPGGFGPQAPNNPLDPVVMDTYMVANAPGYHASQYVGVTVDLLLDILMIASGIGLLQYQKWARKMAITYAVMSLIFKVATLSYQLLVMVPAMTSFYDQALANSPPALQSMAGMMKIGLYGGLFFVALFAVYPIIVLSLLLSKSGKASFEPLPPEDDYEDDYDDRRERFGDREGRDAPRRDDDRYGERDDRGGRY